MEILGYQKSIIRWKEVYGFDILIFCRHKCNFWFE